MERRASLDVIIKTVAGMFEARPAWQVVMRNLRNRTLAGERHRHSAHERQLAWS